MKKIMFVLGSFLFFIILLNQKSFAHSGRTGPTGCHMDYGSQGYHCHKKKQSNPFQTYYYVKYRGNTYGPYSSYSSCMSALRGARLVGGYCSTSKY